MGDQQYTMGISRDSFHKRRKTGGKLTKRRKKRKFELGRPPSMTKIGETRIHSVRTRGGNKKYRALRLNYGNFSWPSESVTKKCRILNVVYNASNNELVRTNTLVKVSISRSTLLPSASGTSSITVSSSARRRKKVRTPLP